MLELLPIDVALCAALIMMAAFVMVRRRRRSSVQPSMPVWEHYRAALDTRLAELDAVEAELAPWAGREPLGPLAARLGCYRGIAELTGLTLAAEVAGWRRSSNPGARRPGRGVVTPGSGT